MRVLVAMSGGVDSSVAAALLLEDGHDVVGVTMKLWGGDSDTGCCSVSDVDDARRVANQLGIEHHVFGFGEDFETHVVAPYVAAHAAGLTPNPCIECNRHLKFDRLLRRADALGFDAVATGHHARVVATAAGTRRIARGADPAKDQSYVLYPLTQTALARTLLPVGAMTKTDVRAVAAAAGLRTAVKPESFEVCFIHSAQGRRGFLGQRLTLHAGTVTDGDGEPVGHVDAVELVTIGQRRGLGLPGGGAARYAVDVDVAARTVTVGTEDDLRTDRVQLDGLHWSDGAAPAGRRRVLAQCSAHGEPRQGTIDPLAGVLSWDGTHRRVAPGQAVVLYAGDEVVGGGTATANRR